jgi:hypothetical protein
MAVFIGGTIALTVTGRLGLPFQQVVTFRGRPASVGDLFQDPRMIRVLRKNSLRVETVSDGSREVAAGSPDGLDFVFPSGKAAPDWIHDNEFDPIPFDAEAARIYGRVCAAVIGTGGMPRRRVADLMIAAIAIAEELPLLTTNPEDYKGLDGRLTVVPVARPTVLHDR